MISLGYKLWITDLGYSYLDYGICFDPVRK